jgi:hypothetical protein
MNFCYDWSFLFMISLRYDPGDKIHHCRMYSFFVFFAVFFMFGIMRIHFKFKQLKNEKYAIMKQEKEELEENPFEMNE